MKSPTKENIKQIATTKNYTTNVYIGSNDDEFISSINKSLNNAKYKIIGFEKSLYYHSFQIPLFMFMTNYSAASIIMPAFIMPLSNVTTKRPAFASTIFLALSKLLSPAAALIASSVLSGATVIFTM